MRIMMRSFIGMIMLIVMVSFACQDTERIVPQEGYLWPNTERSYWPTEEWKTAPAEEHGIDLDKLRNADNMAKNDPSFLSLLIVKDGFIVFENYYNGSSADHSAEVWSVTKSFTSALIGIAIEKGHIKSVNDRMIRYLPHYPQFNELTIKHVLTHTTGLNWNEQSMEWWTKSEDWIAAVLGTGQESRPGEKLLYSSGNSHLLSALLKETTGKTPGEFAQEHLFKPLGIQYGRSNRTQRYTNWQELHVPMPGTWRQDNKGLEIGAFGLHITALEMAKFGFLYLNKGQWNGRSILPEKWVEDSTRDHVLRSENVGFGFHWLVVKRVGQITFDADGWGGQMICVIPAIDMIVVTKCDPVNPRGASSYRVLELAIQSAGT